MQIKINNDVLIIIDKEDFEKVSKYKWRLNNSGYASRNSNNKTLYLHRILINASTEMQVDHINRNKLDNRKSNLRSCTASQNRCNNEKKKNTTSVYRGVCWDKDRFKWVAQISVKHKTIYLGSFLKEKDAALAYNEKAKQIFGEFALINEIKA